MYRQAFLGGGGGGGGDKARDLSLTYDFDIFSTANKANTLLMAVLTSMVSRTVSL